MVDTRMAANLFWTKFQKGPGISEEIYRKFKDGFDEIQGFVDQIGYFRYRYSNLNDSSLEYSEYEKYIEECEETVAEKCVDYVNDLKRHHLKLETTIGVAKLIPNEYVTDICRITYDEVIGELYAEEVSSPYNIDHNRIGKYVDHREPTGELWRLVGEQYDSSVEYELSFSYEGGRIGASFWEVPLDILDISSRVIEKMDVLLGAN
ncbi:MAG: hypothetical protein HQL37_04270 [Alphaproteobacteria bacterium]|nr:hypothetical protein [Alphaproteobacteria bacterium]